MLVLSRQRDEDILIGDRIVVTVVEIRGNSVRIGVQAPREMPVHRREVFEAIEREHKPKADSIDECMRLYGEAFVDLETGESIDPSRIAIRKPHPTVSQVQREEWARTCQRFASVLNSGGQQELAADLFEIANFLRAAA